MSLAEVDHRSDYRSDENGLIRRTDLELANEEVSRLFPEMKTSRTRWEKVDVDGIGAGNAAQIHQGVGRR